jgi:hypothetical protein
MHGVVVSSGVRKYLTFLQKLLGSLILAAALFWIAKLILSSADPRIDLALFIVPGIATSVLAVFWGHVATHSWRIRICFYVVGAVLTFVIIATGLTSYRASLRVPADQERLIMAATEKANVHTDQQVSVVREDLSKVTRHSDNQIAGVRGGLQKKVATITGVVAGNTTDLGKRIETLKPPPPQFARLQFSSFVTQLSQFPVLLQSLRPISDKTFVIDFTIRNVSEVAAEHGDIWIIICQDCKYTREPAGFEKQPAADERQRHMTFERINSGVFLEQMSVEVFLDGPFGSFDTSLKYACETCGEFDQAEKQTIKTIVLPAMPTSQMSSGEYPLDKWVGGGG